MKTAAPLRVISLAGSILLMFSLASHSDDNDSWITDANGCKLRNPRPMPNESVTWTGACQDGYAEGPGVAQWQVDGKPGTQIQASYVHGAANGKAVVISANGTRYEGELLQGQRNGRGVLTGPDGSRYEGNFANGKPEGRGVELLSDGTRYDGEWKDGKPVDPKRIVRPSYALQEHVTGSHLLFNEVTGLSVPIDKTYAELTDAEKRRIKSLYEPMAEDDEPPYPVHGMRTILETMNKLQTKLRVRGALTLAANVDASGKAVSVEVLRSPDIEMAKAMASVLMLQRYKPAICQGRPCAMQFPFRMNFRADP